MAHGEGKKTHEYKEKYIAESRSIHNNGYSKNGSNCSGYLS